MPVLPPLHDYLAAYDQLVIRTALTAIQRSCELLKQTEPQVGTWPQHAVAKDGLSPATTEEHAAGLPPRTA